MVENHIPSSNGQTLGTAPTRADEIEQELVIFYQRDATGLFRYALTLAPDPETARDALQEIFLRYFIARTEGQRFENPKAWLYRVLRNHLVDALRAGHLKNEIGMESLHNSADVRQDPEASYRHTEMSAQLSSSLAPRELECLRLRAEGLQYQEIAGVLAVRSGTVAALLARAHKKIRQTLRQSGYAPPEASSLPVTAPKETPDAS